jgi:GTP-binding protein
MARKAIERAQVCLLLLDGGEGVTAQDTHVAGLVSEAGRGAVVIVNKADLLPAGEGVRRETAERIRERLKFMHDTPLLFASALSGAGVGKILSRALDVGAGYTLRVATGELNRVLRAAWERHPPPGGKRPVRLYYATQTGSAPPRFALFTSTTTGLHFSYMRYLENALREAFPFEGVPVTFIMRGRG